MANPRNTVDFSEIKPLNLTFLADGVTIVYSATAAGGSTVVGRAVRIMPGTSETVELVGDGECVMGQLLRVEPDGKAVVQVGGVVTLPGGDSATLTPGSKIVGDLGAAAAEGYIRSVAAATLAEVAVARGNILDATTATAVQVLLP